MLDANTIHQIASLEFHHQDSQEENPIFPADLMEAAARVVLQAKSASDPTQQQQVCGSSNGALSTNNFQGCQSNMKVNDAI
jgi:hypothetical protein